MSSDQGAEKSTNQTSSSSRGKGVTLQSPSLLDTFQTNVPDQNGVLNNISNANKKVRKKKQKVKQVRTATGGPNQRKRKRSKKVSNSNLELFAKESGNKVTNKSKTNFETPRQGNNGTDLGEFGSSKHFPFDKEESQHNTGENKVQPEEEIQTEQNQSFFRELDDVAFKFEHFALLVEEYLLVLDSMKQ
tara:strand:+ start:883 stop:1449 length:567 start_codon:yes stop_codon:yes gene_type:complete